MKQFDVYTNTDSDTNQAYPYFVDVQTELLDVLNSRVVIPLTTVLPNKGLPNNICPKVEINGEQYYLLTYQITTVARSFLKKHESSLLLNRADVINSIDFLILGI
jgi:toxin CcdB